MLVPALTLAATCAHAGPAMVTPNDPQHIVGGELVPACGWPQIVSMSGSCTGTLVHPEIVTYAAHCGDVMPWIRFAENAETGPWKEVEPEYCVTHPSGQWGFGTDFAYCKLAEPITDVVPLPILMGCEVDEMLQVGQEVMLLGFGNSEEEPQPFDIKHQAAADIVGFSWDEVMIGGDGVGVCHGDSGGSPAVQLADGSWRAFGVASWVAIPCGNGGYFSMLHNGVEWIESDSGIDITPCHDGAGGWDPGPDCHSFQLEPATGGGSWEAGCEIGPLSGYSSSCGDPFDPELTDSTPPTVIVTEPAPATRFELVEGEEEARVQVQVAVDDGNGWGVAEARLTILDAFGNEQLTSVDSAAPFEFPNLLFPTGVWGLQAEATDRAGNIGVSDLVQFGVEADPPAPEPEGTTGTDDGADSDSDAGDAPGDNEATTAVSGCGCASGPGPTPWLLGLILFPLCRRRRIAVAAMLFAGCGDDGSNATGAVDTTTTTTSDAESTSEAPPDVPAEGCGNGELDEGEQCDDGNLEDADGCNADCTHSGSIVWSWARDTNDEGWETANDLAIDGEGNLWIAGQITNVDQGFDAWFAKLTPDGNLLWSDEFAGEAGTHDAALTLAVDPAGNAYVGGYEGTEDDVVSALWLAKLGPNAERLWTHVDDIGVSLDRWEGVVVDRFGGVIAVGEAGYEGGDEAYIVRRYTAAGDLLWSDRDSTRGPSTQPVAHGFGVAMGVNDKVVVLGAESVFLIPNETRIWLQSYDLDGNIQWTRSYGDPLSHYWGNDIAVDDFGNIAMCGRIHRGSADEIIVSMFDHMGDQVWVRKFAGMADGIDECSGIAIDQGTVLMVGSTFHIDHAFEIWVNRTNYANDVVWSRLYLHEGFKFDYGGGIALGDGAEIYISGSADLEAGRSVWAAELTR